jgi:hypothetical protein
MKVGKGKANLSMFIGNYNYLRIIIEKTQQIAEGQLDSTGFVAILFLLSRLPFSRFPKMTQPQQPATTSQTAPNGANWKNVNNWHWVEKNCLPWARDYLTQRLEKLTFKDPSGKGSVWVEKVQKVC